jgi:hypothetical protein
VQFCRNSLYKQQNPSEIQNGLDKSVLIVPLSSLPNHINHLKKYGLAFWHGSCNSKGKKTDDGRA